MDPETALNTGFEAVADDDLDAALECLLDYHDWVRKGGWTNEILRCKAELLNKFINKEKMEPFKEDL